MNVLIVESNADLGRIWSEHVSRQGVSVTLTTTQKEAAAALMKEDFSVVILDLDLEDGSPLALADLASYKRPNAKILLVTKSTFFSDGSIFQHVPNACGFMAATANPSDLAALVEHHAKGAS